VKANEVKTGKEAESGREGAAGKKEKENWYLPYMDKKTRGIAVEDKPNPVAVFYCALKTPNKAKFQVDRHLTLSKDLEISKHFDLNSQSDAAKIAKAIEQEILEIYNG
jgi:hypothetical protein